MISTKEYEALYQILNNKEETLERVVQQFTELFSPESYYATFRGCYTLGHLIKLNLLTSLQRLIAIFIIYETYRIEGIKKNPFGGILFEVHNKTHDLYEAKFIAEMLIDNKRDKFFKLKIEVLNEESQMFDENYKVRQQMEALEKSWVEACPRIPAAQASQISNVVYASSSKDRVVDIPEEPMNKDSLRDQEINSEAFNANYLRPLPEFVEVKSSEFCWLSPGIFNDISWDPIAERNNKGLKVKYLYHKALLSPLPLDQIMDFIKITDEYPAFIWNEFHPDHTLELVNKNPYVAGEVFCKLVGHSKFQNYLPKILSLKLSLNSMHAMALFMAKNKPPAAVISYYLITNINMALDMEVNSVNQKLINLFAVLAKKLIFDLNWTDGDIIEEKVNQLLEKYPKSEHVNSLAALFV